MIDQLCLRAATVEDHESLLDLQSAAMIELSAGLYDRSEMELALREVPLLTSKLLAEGHYFVLETPSGRIVAGGGWSRATPGYAVAAGQSPAELPAGVSIIRSVYVAPDFARRGLGRRIMEAVEWDATEHGIFKFTLTATLPGIPLYRALGYREIKPASAVLSSGYRLELLEMEKLRSRARVAA